MKIVVYGPDKRTGVLSGEEIVDIAGAVAKRLHEQDGEAGAAALAEALAPSDLERFIAGGDRALDNAQIALDHLGDAHDRTGIDGRQVVFRADAVKLHAPRPPGTRVACAGGNFADHAEAMAARAALRGDMRAFEGDAREAIRNTGIWGFWKVDRESVGPGGDVIYPERCKRLDYEGELAIVIGPGGKDIAAERISDHIWGITLLSDWSARMTLDPGPLKFALQKNFDTCCSIGPCIVVGEADPFDCEVETLVNGERRQHYSTKDMVFSFGEYLEHLSRDFTFYPGDIISGGTAAGTAADSSPLLPDNTPSAEWFLKPGDVVDVISPAVGTLTAHIVAKKG